MKVAWAMLPDWSCDHQVTVAKPSVAIFVLMPPLKLVSHEDVRVPSRRFLVQVRFRENFNETSCIQPCSLL